MKPKKGKGGPFEVLGAMKAELEKREAAAQKPGHKPAPPAAARPRSPAAATREPEDENLLFHRLFAGVTPLDRAPGRVPLQATERSPAAEKAAARGAEAAEAEAEAVREHLRALVEDRARFEVSDDGVHAEGRRIDLPVATLRRLRRGSIAIDARIDLHGMVLAEGRAHLDLFVRTMRTRGERCVLVIHGKGNHSPGGVGVLRGEIAAWLSQGPSSEHVAAFATARDEDGGEGAMYVLLRK
jgi:DNA-nicking Smr family endonuclease